MSGPCFSDRDDAALAQYQAVCSLAVGGLIVGLLAPLALLHPLLWVLPAVGIVLSVAALVRIARLRPALIGRTAAVVGLFLSLSAAVAAPTDWLAHRWLLRHQARQFARRWFELLAQEEPQKAFQLAVHPRYRRPLDERLWDYYRGGPRGLDELKNYVAQPPVRALLALGPKARVRYWQCARQGHEGDSDMLQLVYAVSYEESGQKKTFFVQLHLQRIKLESGLANWRLLRTEGGIRPEGF